MNRRLGWCDLRGRFLGVVIVYCLLAALGIYSILMLVRANVANATQVAAAIIVAHDPVPATVTRVVDGDTIEVHRKGFAVEDKAKVRLLLVDSPEKAQHPWGDAARLWTTVELASKDVILEYDNTKPDPYGRELCYVFYMTNDGHRRLFNEDLLRAGWAFYYDPGPKLRYTAIALTAEAAAKKAKVGVHAECHCPLVIPSEYRNKAK